MLTKTRIEKKALKLLNDIGITKPVDISLDKLSKYLGIEIVPQEYPNELGISAILLKEAGRQVISVNKGHSKRRKRFSIAHEMGHLLLHADMAFLIVDKGLEKQLLFTRRDNLTDTNEREANQFAAALLMPKDMIIDDFKRLYEKSEEAIVSKLADRYNVSQDALTYRLMNLNLL